ncbi:hypothetical protein J437_LFUL007339 [Ladona fulva]|uniref:Uncharacterized protein n=1 Tax=Ladona fulva TaxID=123851 RepID=A0A8K0KH83_LADFU|nr:hypothetical protein J437_LFUL007339 [Ladona fulva]
MILATQVGGAFLSGTAEEVYKNGILWCCVPFAYISGMILNGATFAKTMRRRGYVTVFDPIQENFGRVMGGLCVVPHIIGDLFWIGAVLSVLVSSSVSAERNVLLGFLALPFILTCEAVVRGGYGEAKDWFGSISSNQAGTYVDTILVPFLGGIPWQNIQKAWNETDFGSGVGVEDASLILPLALRYLLPSAVTFVGVGAVTAAVISTIDSTVLGAGSAIANNIYKGLLRKKVENYDFLLFN